MGLNINLFVHGVPMGQKMWGPKGDDQLYINSFYGPKWDVPELLKVDVMTFGGINYCYYSFVKGMNVCDSQGRAGSYFALTLRVNALYIDIQNVYSILKATYSKMCAGLCVLDNGNSVRYLIADFSDIDSQLKAIEQSVLNYIGEYSVSEDIASADGLKSNSVNPPIVTNLFECTPAVAINALKTAGKILVSSYYPSSQVKKVSERYETEIMNLKQRTTQEIDGIKKVCQEDILRNKEKAEKDLQRTKEEGEQKLKEITSRFAKADTEISQLKQEKTQIEKEKSLVEKEIKQVEKDKENLNIQLKQKQDKIDALEKKVNDTASEVQKMKEQLRGFAQGASLGTVISGCPPEPKDNCQSNHKKALKYLLYFFIIAFVVSAISLGLYFVMSSNNGTDSQAGEGDEKEETPKAEENVVEEDTIVITYKWKDKKTLDVSYNNSNAFEGGARWESDELDIKNPENFKTTATVKKNINVDTCILKIVMDGAVCDSILIPKNW